MKKWSRYSQSCCCRFRVTGYWAPWARMVLCMNHNRASHYIHCSLFLAQCKSQSDSSTAPFHQMCRTRFIAQHDCYHNTHTPAKIQAFYCILCCATNASLSLFSRLYSWCISIFHYCEHTKKVCAKKEKNIKYSHKNHSKKSYDKERHSFMAKVRFEIEGKKME